MDRHAACFPPLAHGSGSSSGSVLDLVFGSGYRLISGEVLSGMNRLWSLYSQRTDFSSNPSKQEPSGQYCAKVLNHPLPVIQMFLRSFTGLNQRFSRIPEGLSPDLTP